MLTLDWHGYYSGQKWGSTREAYQGLSRMLRNAWKELRRACKARGWRDPGSDWVAVVEAHRSGKPHMNLLFRCPELALELEQEQRELEKSRTHREAILLRGDWQAIFVHAGFGLVSTLEPAKSVAKLTNYVVKLAGEALRTTHELAKLTQSPLNAPVRFRRLRSGKGFLPPRHKNPEVTGTLIRRAYREDEGAWSAITLHRIAEEQRPLADLACRLESERIERRATMLLVGMPPPDEPQVYWVRGDPLEKVKSDPVENPLGEA